MRVQKGQFRVDKKFKPKPDGKVKFSLALGEAYYIFLGNNIVTRCRLTEKWHDGAEARITVRTTNEVPAREIHMYPDELGRTPEEAIINRH